MMLKFGGLLLVIYQVLLYSLGRNAGNIVLCGNPYGACYCDYGIVSRILLNCSGLSSLYTGDV